MDNSPYFASIYHAINFFMTGIYLWATHTPAVNLFSLSDFAANQAQVHWNFARIDCFPSFSNHSRYSQNESLWHSRCAPPQCRARTSYSWLVGHNFISGYSLDFASCPSFYHCPHFPLTMAFKMAALKRLKQLKWTIDI